MLPLHLSKVFLFISVRSRSFNLRLIPALNAFHCSARSARLLIILITVDVRVRSAQSSAGGAASVDIRTSAAPPISPDLMVR